MGIQELFRSSNFRRIWGSILVNLTQRFPVALRWKHSGGGPYKAVIFDMGGVLVPSPLVVAAEWEAQNHIPSGTIGKALITGGENRPWMKYMRGEMTAAAFLQEFGRQCSEMTDSAVPVDSFLSLLTNEKTAKQFSVMTEAIRRIRAKGFKTAVLSNNFYLPSGDSFLPLDRKQFDVIVESCREGICKPDPLIYKLCLERLGVEPAESIFLDDLGQNIKAAAQLGIHTVKVGDPETALKELETYLGFPLQENIPNTCSVKKAMEIPRDSLAQYLKNLLGSQTTGPLELRQFSQGQSNLTYYVRFADRRLVLRKKPPGKRLPSAHTVVREYRIMKALADTGVPVPKVLALCEDSSVIGSPFYLMEYCSGQIYKDPSLPGMEPSQRQAIYAAMNKVLCKLHSIDIKAAGLEDYGKPGDYFQHQVQTRIKQYRATETHTIPSMERLIEWLPLHLPRTEKATVVHGDFRLNNLIFHPEKAEVLCVLDWELSTLGDPLADVAYNCLAHYLPPNFHILKGLSDCDLTQQGIPTAEEYFRMYCLNRGLPPVENWNFYMAFSSFHVATILQDVYKRSLTGQASSSAAEQSGKKAEFMSNLGWDFAVKEGFRLFRDLPATKPLARSYCTWARPNLLLSANGTRRSCAKFSEPPETHGILVISPETLSTPVQKLDHKLKQLVEDCIYPVEQEPRNHQISERRWALPSLMEELKYGDASVMWYRKAEGSLTDSFARGKDPVVFFLNRTPGVLDPHCQLCVFMGKTNLHAQHPKLQSMLLVLIMDTPGIKVISDCGLDDAPGEDFGAAGGCHYPLAQFLAWARALLFADGPDGVHRATVAKVELKY